MTGNQIDEEFKGRWDALGHLAPERLSALRRIATIESVGSSTRIEGVKLADEEVEKLLKGLDIRSFRSRDEQEVAGYAELMDCFQIFNIPWILSIVWFRDGTFSKGITVG